MSSEDLFVILGMIRAEMREIKTDEDWEMAKRLFSKQAGGTRVYCPTLTLDKKRLHLDKIESMGDVPPKQVSKMLGISVRHVRRLRRLR